MIPNSQSKLVERLINKGVISTPAVIQALSSIDRGCFISGSASYEDRPRQIGFKATISAPHMHGYALEWLKDFLIPGCSALDVGSGSGYLTLCLAEMMNYRGKVVGVEHIRELVERSVENISRCRADALRTGCVEIVEADGRSGFAKYAPYKAIHVGAAVETIPEALIQQLDCGGRMIIPVGRINDTQRIVVVDKNERGEVKKQNLLSVVYIPLCDKRNQYT
jgi:protein-L-isoaspartate(D-aspartate) O-methyltransferase